MKKLLRKQTLVLFLIVCCLTIYQAFPQNPHKFGFSPVDTIKPQPYKLLLKLNNGTMNTGATFESYTAAYSFGVDYLHSFGNFDSNGHPNLNTFQIVDTKTNIYLPSVTYSGITFPSFINQGGGGGIGGTL